MSRSAIDLGSNRSRSDKVWIAGDGIAALSATRGRTLAERVARGQHPRRRGQLGTVGNNDERIRQGQNAEEESRFFCKHFRQMGRGGA